MSLIQPRTDPSTLLKWEAQFLLRLHSRPRVGRWCSASSSKTWLRLSTLLRFWSCTPKAWAPCAFCFAWAVRNHLSLSHTSIRIHWYISDISDVKRFSRIQWSKVVECRLLLCISWIIFINATSSVAFGTQLWRSRSRSFERRRQGTPRPNLCPRDLTLGQPEPPSQSCPIFLGPT